MSTVTDSISVQAAKEHPLPELRAGQVVGGRYEVQQRVAEGLMGAVYKAKDTKGGGTVALKILRKRILREALDAGGFQQELSTLKKLDNPGIVKFLDGGEFEGSYFVVSEFVSGQSLRELLNDHKAKGEDLPSRDVAWILIDVLEAMRVAHTSPMRVVHEDIKPENILLVEENGPEGKRNRVRLADFGLTRLLSSKVFENGTLNRENAWYLAPELGGFGVGQPNVDTYSVGAIFYEMITGVPPVGSYERASVLRTGEISEKIDDVIETALSPEAQNRYQTAEAMLEAMKSTLSALPGLYDPKQRSMVMVLLGVLALAAIAGVAYVAGQPTEEELRAAEITRRQGVVAGVKGSAGGAAPGAAEGKYTGMQWVPAGKFVQGKWSKYDDEGMPGELVERVAETKGFWIDRLEGHHPEDAAADALRPLRGLSYAEAEQSCDAAGKRLCTEEEWEKACKGPENTIYAYHDTFDVRVCPGSGWFNPGYSVGKYAGCESGYGAMDMSGGLLEWTSTKEGDKYVLKGGKVGAEQKGTRCSARVPSASAPEGKEKGHTGVRCCAD